MKELFKDIPDYEGYYQIDELGTVRNFKTGKIIKQMLNKGYYIVSLHKKGKRRTFSISQLIAMAFLSHKPDGHTLVIDHKNNISTDDRLDNLQIITTRENSSKDRTNPGVNWDKRREKWRARIQINGKRVHLGMFKAKQDAINAYQNRLKEL